MKSRITFLLCLTLIFCVGGGVCAFALPAEETEDIEYKSETEAVYLTEEIAQEADLAILQAQEQALLSRMEVLEKQKVGKEASYRRMRALRVVGEASSDDVNAASDEIAELDKQIALLLVDLQSVQKKLEKYGSEEEEEAEAFAFPKDSSFWEGYQEKLIEHAFAFDSGYAKAQEEMDEAFAQAWDAYADRAVRGEEIPEEISDALYAIGEGEEIDEDALLSVYDDFLDRLAEEKAAREQAALEAEQQAASSQETEDSSDELIYAAEDETKEQPSADEEDEDPYRLYDAILLCQETTQNLADLAEELNEAVEEAYEQLQKTWIEFDSFKMDEQSSGMDLRMNRVRFLLGEKSREEYEAAIDGYDTEDENFSEAQCEYLSALYETEKVTSGGLSALWEELAEEEEEEETAGAQSEEELPQP